MLANPMIFGISAILAASFYIAPLCFRSSKRSTRLMLVLALYVAVASSVGMFYGLKSALAEVLLGLIFAGVAEMLLINARLIQTAHYPKNRRCY